MPGRTKFYKRRRENSRRWAATNASTAPAVAMARSHSADCEFGPALEVPVFPVAGGPGAGVVVTVATGVTVPVTVAAGVPVGIGVDVEDGVRSSSLSVFPKRSRMGWWLPSQKAYRWTWSSRTA